jgi:hypothetical protein
MLDPDALRDMRAAASALSDQALAALNEPDRAMRLIRLAAAVRANLDELADAIGSYEIAAMALSGSLQAVLIAAVAEQRTDG